MIYFILRQLRKLLLPRLYTPEQLGITQFPEIRAISIGGCGSRDETHYFPFSTELAHAHTCEEDKSNGLLCFREKQLLTKNNGRILRHEVAHLRVKFRVPCKAREIIIASLDPLSQLMYGHNEEWMEEARKLGIRNPSPWN